MINRVYGYCRVSSKDQNEDRQLEALKMAGIDERFIFIDKASGKDFNRPQYLILKNALREGDTLVIKSIDRLGRNYEGIIDEWKIITKEIKANIKVLDLPLLDTSVDTKDLTGTFIADLVLQILSYVSETERQNIKRRQAEGISIAKASGKHLGRPKAEFPENFIDIYNEWKKGNITAKTAMETLSLKRSTFYKLVQQHETNNE